MAANTVVEAVVMVAVAIAEVDNTVTLFMAVVAIAAEVATAMVMW